MLKTFFLLIVSIAKSLLVISQVANPGCSIASNPWPTSLNNGLVAWYPFNGNANDESHNGNDPDTVGATLTADRYGNLNAAYHFDSTHTVYKGTLH